MRTAKAARRRNIWSLTCTGKCGATSPFSTHARMRTAARQAGWWVWDESMAIEFHGMALCPKCRVGREERAAIAAAVRSSLGAP